MNHSFGEPRAVIVNTVTTVATNMNPSLSILQNIKPQNGNLCRDLGTEKKCYWDVKSNFILFLCLSKNDWLLIKTLWSRHVSRITFNKFKVTKKSSIILFI